MRTLFSFAALFLSITFVQLSSGSLGPIDVLAGAGHGFATAEIGLLGSAHFVGFFIGCWLTPILLGGVGHARAFAAMAAIGAIAALMHPVVIDPIAWAVFRVGSGCAVAGAYTIAESWIQSKVTNDTRGRVVGIYRLVDMTASVGAQGLVALLDPSSYITYNLIAAMCCLCLIPLTVTKSTPPLAGNAPRLHPIRTLMVSPLAAFSVIVIGITNSGFRMVGPVYALENGLDATEVAGFMAAGIAGGALAQWPMGWISDKIDRRKVLIVASGLSGVVCFGISAGVGAGNPAAIYASSFAFGFIAFPLYSIAVAHANDFAKPDDIVELNAGLMFFYAVGAMISPLFAAGLIERYGPSSLFVYILTAHMALVIFGLWRMTRRPAPKDRTRYRYLPRTSFLLERLLRPGK